MGKAASSVDQLGSKMKSGMAGMAQSAATNTAAWNTVGSTFTKVGAVAAAGLGLAAKAAVDWESAWAGVRKTVDQSSPAFATLEDDLRGMAREMATSHTEIAAVAEAAGALGVATGDVAEFTRTMIMLGETTNLSANEAADSLAQFMNIMGTAPQEVGALGSALVALGNDGASTERQIVQMGQRIAGAGRQIGLSEAQVMGFASAMASVGIEVEAGGTAISSTMLKMEQAVRNGGQELDTLAKTAGMSTAEFKRAFETDAAGAIQAFIEGLGRAGAAGEDVTGILNELGITGIREADTLRRLANAGDLLGDSLDTANNAFRQGTALLDEYAERANTTESKMRVAWNNIVDAAITAGQSMLPVLSQAAEMVSGLAGAFAGMDPAVAGFGVAAAATVAAIGLLGGAAMKAIVGLAELRVALTALGISGAVSGALGRVGSALVAVGRYALPAAAALGALVVIDTIRGHTERAVPSLDAMTRSLERLTRTGQDLATSGIDEMFTSSTFDDVTITAGRVDGLSDAFARLHNATQSDQIAMWWDRNIGLGRASQATALAESIGVMDQALVKLVETGRGSEAHTAFEQIYQEAMKLQVPIGDLANKYFPAYRDSLQAVADMAGYTIQSEQEMVNWMRGQVPAAIREAAAANPALQAELDKTSGSFAGATLSAQQYANQLLALSGSEVAIEQAISNLNDSLAQNGKNFDVTTQAGRQNITMLDQLGAASQKRIQTLAEAGTAEEEQVRIMARAREAYVQAATAMTGSREEAERMADAFFATIPPNKQAADQARATAVEFARESESVKGMTEALKEVPPETKVSVSGEGIEPTTVQARDLMEYLQKIPHDKVITVTMPNGKPLTGTAAEIEAALLGAGEAGYGLAEALAKVPAEKKLLISAPGLSVTTKSVQDIRDHIKDIPPDVMVRIVMPDGRVVEMKAKDVNAELDRLDGKTANPKVTLDADAAEQRAQELDSTLGGIKDKHIIVSADGLKVTVTDMKNLGDKIKDVPDNKDVKVTIDGKEYEFTAGEIREWLAKRDTKGIQVNSNAEEEKAKLEAFGQTLMDLPPEQQITISAPGLEATKGNLDTLKSTVEGMPPDKQITITLPGAEPVILTAQQVRDIIAQIEGKDVDINANPAGALTGALQAQSAIDNVTGTTVDVGVNPGPAISGSASAQGAINGVTGKTVDVNADPAGARAGAAAAIAAINSVQGKTVYINVELTGPGASRMAVGGLVTGIGGVAGPEWAGAQALAGGGRVAGWSPHPKADNVPIWATAGEFMQPVSAVQKYGLRAMHAIRTGKLDPYHLDDLLRAQGLADGGTVKARDAFSRPAYVTSGSSSSSGASGVTNNKNVTQEFHYHYPVGERESTATRRAAASAGLAAIAG